MEQKSIENDNVENNDEVIEPTIEKKDATGKENETGFPFRLPPGIDQQFGGMFSSMIQQNQSIFDQLMGGKHQHTQSRKDSNNNTMDDRDDHSRPQTVRPDIAGKMFEQSLGMINQMFRDQGTADMFGKFFGGHQRGGGGGGGDGSNNDHSSPAEQQPHVYPKLDDLNDNNKQQQQQQPQSHPKGQIDVETLLKQGIDLIGLKINDQNAGDLLGQLMGQMKRPTPPSSSAQTPDRSSATEERHFYPKLDDLDVDNSGNNYDKPKPQQPKPTATNQINLDNVLNQGFDAIGSALKGNAGSIFSSFLKNSISTKTTTTTHGGGGGGGNSHNYDQSPSQPTPPQPSPAPSQPFKTVDVEFPDDVRPSAPPASGDSIPIKMPAAEPIKQPEQRKTESKDDEDDDKKETKTKDGEKILDFIPDDAFEAAFDAMAFGGKK